MNHQMRKSLERAETDKNLNEQKEKQRERRENLDIFTKNNLIVFFTHIVLVLLFVLVAMAFDRKYINWIIYRLAAFIFVIPYVIMGYKLNNKLNKKFDYLSGTIVTIIGFVISTIVFMVGDGKILAEAANSSMFWRLSYSYIDIFYRAFLWGWTNFKNMYYINLILCLVPSFLVGLGMKLRRFMEEPME
ncbi:hypothetical protein SAMN02745248_01128 [Hathewaya proteolytica DSM 3090]|uniref:Uncharacterized protein n=1 Tax=Hathewaya proteolytica DSM 3090 TaxID=1121331 RepID=A0A1M6MR68_9CLOT|nr:hypothetical protein [Hathewaya proteolytica]SHJ85947.1 hypothetical protein SAMN02745248_01128 [Hathewaya proteolytica DSM 3090]